MTLCKTHDSSLNSDIRSNGWEQFLQCVKKKCSSTAYGNWFSPIKVLDISQTEISLEIPNIFVKEYLLTNHKDDLCSFLPVNSKGDPAIIFIIAKVSKKTVKAPTPKTANSPQEEQSHQSTKLNQNYRFETFIDGPSNQFVKSAAVGVSTRPGQSYNPLFIHGGVGRGKTHILHSIAHHIKTHNKKLKIQCITTEAFINELVDNLKNKSVERMKRYYRSDVDVLLVDDIQFLQNRLNFEEEFCNTFETLINQNKQIVITSDKPPSQLHLSERMIARMEWGLVAHLGMPELETRVAILNNKAKLKGLELPNDVSFFIAEHLYNNVRQLEGAINRLSAHCRLLDKKINMELVHQTLSEMLQYLPEGKVTVDQILLSVAAVFQIRVTDLKGKSRTKDVSTPRQIAMHLACKLINSTLQSLSDSFGKKHSTILHACKTIEKKLENNELLKKQIGMVERHLQKQ